MDLLARGRRLLLIALGASAACAGARGGAPVGVSNGPAVGSSGARDAGIVVRGDAGIPANFEATMKKMNAAPFVTSGHAAGRWDADVFANDEGAAALQEQRGEAQPGAMLVMVHRERSSATPGARGPIMMMEKRPKGYDAEHGDWRYVVIASNGDVVSDGPTPSCAECHGEAPKDHLFKVE